MPEQIAFTYHDPEAEHETDMTDTASPRFETDIKPLFRESDRDAMRAVFDLWSFADVKANAGKILAAVRAGVMPCDMRWPDEQVDTLQRWVDGGTPQ
jgi:hypothetical protein